MELVSRFDADKRAIRRSLDGVFEILAMSDIVKVVADELRRFSEKYPDHGYYLARIWEDELLGVDENLEDLLPTICAIESTSWPVLTLDCIFPKDLIVGVLEATGNGRAAAKFFGILFEKLVSSYPEILPCFIVAPNWRELHDTPAFLAHAVLNNRKVFCAHSGKQSQIHLTELSSDEILAAIP